MTLAAVRPDAVLDADLDRALTLAEAAAGIGAERATPVGDCYLDAVVLHGRQVDLELAILFDESKLAGEFDVETTEPRGDPPRRSCDVSVRVRTGVLFNEFSACLIVDHFISVIEPALDHPLCPGQAWSSGKYGVASRLMRQLGWTAPYGPGEEPVRRRQCFCRIQSEAVRTAVAAADEWFLDVSTALRPVHAEIDREQAVKALSGQDLADETASIPI